MEEKNEIEDNNQPLMIERLFKKHRSVGVLGNSNTAKSSVCLNELLKLKKKFKIEIYVFGVERDLYEYLESKGIKILNSVDDILDMKIKEAVIYIDEFADIYDTNMASKQTNRIRRFFNRLYHLNNYVLISTSQSKFWNVFMCSMIKAYIVKEIDFDSLVRGTFLKRKIINISGNNSEYRLEAKKNEYYVVTNEDIVRKGNFGYNKELDSKKNLVNPFVKMETKINNKESHLKLESSLDLNLEKKNVIF